MRYLPFTPSPKATTTDAEIIRRRWLFLDIDPTRPVGMSSTDVEKQTAIVLATDIQETLRAGVEPWGKTFPEFAGVPSNRAQRPSSLPTRGGMAGAFNADRPEALLASDGCRLREGGKGRCKRCAVQTTCTNKHQLGPTRCTKISKTPRKNGFRR